MVSIYDVEPRKLIQALAEELKKMPEMAPPEWANFVKTGVSKERPPVNKDWWYVRTGAILRSVYKYGPIGVSKLRTKYGGRKNRGHAPHKVYKAGGNIIRKILQKLELVGFIKQDQVGIHKGRVITPQGKSFVDKIVVKIKKPYTKPKKVKKEKKEEKKPEKKEEPKKKAEEEKEKGKKKEKKTEKKETKKEEKKEKKTEKKETKKPAKKKTTKKKATKKKSTKKKSSTKKK